MTTAATGTPAAAQLLAEAPWPSRYVPPPVRVEYDVPMLDYRRDAPGGPMPESPAVAPAPGWVGGPAARTAASAFVARWGPVLPALGDEPAAAPTVALLLEHPQARPAALAWLERWPEAAAIGLLPTVMGRPDRRQLLAQVALAHVLAGHPELVRVRAAEQGATAPAWIERLARRGPQDCRDWNRVRPSPPWAIAPPVLLTDGNAMSAAQMKSFFARVRLSRRDDPYLHLDVVRDACSAASLDRFSAALLGAWIDAGAPEDAPWAAEQIAFWGGEAVAEAIGQRRAALTGRSGAKLRVQVQAQLEPVAPPAVAEALAALRPAATPRPSSGPRVAFALTAAERDFGFKRFDGRSLRPDAGSTLVRLGWSLGHAWDDDLGSNEVEVEGPGGAQVVVELREGLFPFRRRAAQGALVLGRVGLPGIPPLPLPPDVAEWLDARLGELVSVLGEPGQVRGVNDTGVARAGVAGAPGGRPRRDRD